MWCLTTYYDYDAANINIIFEMSTKISINFHSKHIFLVIPLKRQYSFPIFQQKMPKKKKLLIFATTYLPRFPLEQRAQGKFFYTHGN